MLTFLKQYGNRPMLGRILYAALVLIEILILPDDLERYLGHSSFRKDRSNGIVDSEEKEIEIMQRAVGSTI